MQTDVSIIICTYDRAPLLRRALLSLARQSVPPQRFEVVVVDDGSRDRTAEVCAEMRLKLPKLRYLPRGENSGVARARNVGIEAAQAETILFLDDDCIAHRFWVERMQAALENEPIVVGAMESPMTNYFKLCHNIAEFYPFMPGQKAGPKEFISCANLGVHRSVLRALEGFTAGQNIGEDMDFILRARTKGYQAYFAADAVVTHDPDRTTLASILKYTANHAATTVLLRNRYRSLLGTPFVLRSPWLVLAASPLIALKVTLGIYLHNRRLARLYWTAPCVYTLKLAWCWGASQGLKKMALAKKCL